MSSHMPLTGGGESFIRFGQDDPITPVILSVPHAERDYPGPLVAQARMGMRALQRLEDRFADRLVDQVVAAGHSVIIARTARAAIDLNRDEREIDPAMIRGLPQGFPAVASGKMRGGLGLLPRRLQGYGELWRAPFDWADVAHRIEAWHRPYHAALVDLMRRARSRHGHAILLDLHSMPPLPPQPGGTPRIVLGDRFGRGASARLVSDLAALCEGRDIAVARNHPYAGDHVISRHGRPERHFHAVQIEIDRSLYLDAGLDQPGQGLAAMQGLVMRMVDVAAQALPRLGPRSGFMEAAE